MSFPHSYYLHLRGLVRKWIKLFGLHVQGHFVGNLPETKFHNLCCNERGLGLKVRQFGDKFLFDIVGFEFFFSLSLVISWTVKPISLIPARMLL